MFKFQISGLKTKFFRSKQLFTITPNLEIFILQK